MILQSRKWRLLLRMITLVITSTLMLAFAAPASYALQDDRPKLITAAGQLFDKQVQWIVPTLRQKVVQIRS